MPNVLKLAPWVWDNIKVLFYWWVGFAPLVALVLATWWSRSRAVGRAVVAGVLVSLTLAGSLDVWRVVSGQTTYGEFDPDGVALAAAIRDRTPPDAVILHAPTWNPPVFLTGRRSVLGYTGYIWAHGLPYADRERDIRAIYAGGADAMPLLRQYGVDFVEVTPLERDLDARLGRVLRDADAGCRDRRVPALRGAPWLTAGRRDGRESRVHPAGKPPRSAIVTGGDDDAPATPARSAGLSGDSVRGAGRASRPGASTPWSPGRRSTGRLAHRRRA